MDGKRVLSFGIVGLLACASAQPKRLAVVIGSSMSPTYKHGEVVWTLPVDRPLQRGDVVVVDSPSGPVIKRIALLAGDRHLEWRLPTGQWTEMIVARTFRRSHPERIRQVVVPPGTVYVLGDHLLNSVDSRDFGPVRVSNVRRIVEEIRRPDKSSDIALASPMWRVG